MSFSSISNSLGEWLTGKRFSYSSMGGNETTRAGPRTSFVYCFDGDNTTQFQQWPNSTIEEDHHYGQQSIAASRTEILLTWPFSLPQRPRIFDTVKWMCTKFPVHDMSWATGFTFTIGSAFFVVNGFFLLLPLVAPATNFTGETPYATPATSVAGSFIFILGGYSGMLEGLNLKREGMLEGGADIYMSSSSDSDEEESMEIGEKQDDPKSNKPPFEQTYSSGSRPRPGSSSPSRPSPEPTIFLPAPSLALIDSDSFIWWPTMQQFRQTYCRDIPFIAGLVQFVGTLVFAIAALTAVPGIINFENISLVQAVNLFPATLGGAMFLIAAALQISVTQEYWYMPNLWRLDWHIGFWNCIGSIGFTLAGALPFIGSTEATFQATLADFWGSWAFLIASFLQWYMAIGKYPN